MPKYLHVANTLEGEIRSLKHRAGSRIGTEAEIQQRFGVSSITARHAFSWLRHKGLIERRRRLGTFVVEHPFQPKEGHSIQPSHHVGLMWEALPSTRLGIELLSVIENELAKTGYGLLFRASGNDPQKARECLEWFHANGIQRVLLTPAGTRHETAIYEEFRQRDMRLVFMDRAVDAPHFSLVGFDDVQIGRLAARELRQAGSRKLAIVTTSRADTSVDDRLHGAIEECCVQNLPSQIFPISMEAFMQLIQQPLSMVDWWRDLHAQTGCGTGWFGVNEDIASALLRIMLHEGVKVTADCSVVGVGNMQLDTVSALFLSSIALPFRQWGEEAVRCLMSDEEDRIQLPPSGVVRRGSTTAGADVRWDEQQKREQFYPIHSVAAA